MVTGKNFLEVLNGRQAEKVPFWFMRQAGRYLPEYRELRAKSGGFLKMVYNPKVAAEITMQPIRRFGMSAAIIFSDILVIPQALGQRLEFTEGEGPKLDPLKTARDFGRLNFNLFESTLTPVYEAISTVKSQLNAAGFADTALIGFCGAPWTLAAYMVEGGGSKEFMAVKSLAYRAPEDFSELIGTLVEANILYLSKQVEAGAEALQIFDSWAGVLEESEFKKWVIEPTKEIVAGVRKNYPSIPIIGFPRAAGVNYIPYAKETGVTAIGLDTQVPAPWAAQNLQNLLPVQGNLDPACLFAGGAALADNTNRILEGLGKKPFVFNLGHGVHKDTPVAHVEALVKILKEHKP